MVSSCMMTNYPASGGDAELQRCVCEANLTRGIDEDETRFFPIRGRADILVGVPSAMRGFPSQLPPCERAVPLSDEFRACAHLPDGIQVWATAASCSAAEEIFNTAAATAATALPSPPPATVPASTTAETAGLLTVHADLVSSAQTEPPPEAVSNITRTLPTDAQSAAMASPDATATAQYRCIPKGRPSLRVCRTGDLNPCAGVTVADIVNARYAVRTAERANKPEAVLREQNRSITNACQFLDIVEPTGVLSDLLETNRPCTSYAFDGSEPGLTDENRHSVVRSFAELSTMGIEACELLPSDDQAHCRLLFGCSQGGTCNQYIPPPRELTVSAASQEAALKECDQQACDGRNKHCANDFCDMTDGGACVPSGAKSAYERAEPV